LEIALVIITSYHNHTRWSDGKATVAEMIEAARRAGLNELGISDHFVLNPDGRQSPRTLAPQLIGDYVNSVREAAASTPDLAVRLGLEADYTPETVDLLAKKLTPFRFDYLIGSVHYIDGISVDSIGERWRGLSPEDRDRIWASYWRKLHEAVQTNLFDIVGHFDLPKKFNFPATAESVEEGLRLLDAIADSKMTLELNTSGWDRPVREAYPSVFYLKEAFLRGIPIIITSDAHSAEDIVGHFDRAQALAIEVGYRELTCFNHRKATACPLLRQSPSPLTSDF
jgi:histidinol-phosphatase (PHP family)